MFYIVELVLSHADILYSSKHLKGRFKGACPWMGNIRTLGSSSLSGKTFKFNYLGVHSNEETVVVAVYVVEVDVVVIQ